MQIMTEETFGPVMPVMSFGAIEDAIRLANDTIYGLSGAVIAGDAVEAEGIAEQMDAGAITTMDTTLTGTILLDAEKMAFKRSGMGGTRMGPGSIMRFFRKMVVTTQTAQPADIFGLGEDTLQNPAAHL